MKKKFTPFESLVQWKIFCVIGIFLVLLTSSLNANPTSPEDAKTIVKVWLTLDSKPLKTSIGHQVKEVKTFTDDNGINLYYVVYLNPSGFVIVPADDWIEPIICFADDGVFKSSLDNPLGALVINDLKTRMRNVRKLMEKTKDKKEFFPLPVRFSKAKEKWDFLRKFKKDKLSALGIQNISDVRVEPLIQSKWGQTTVKDTTVACYNYYTPPGPEGSSSNYPCGCVATAMAQLMRFYQHPTEGVGTRSFTIYVDGVPQEDYLRGGDGLGGPYDWENMPLVPDSTITEIERQAIGALCHDAGVSVNMNYTAGKSGAWVRDAADSLVNTFGYSNAIKGFNSGYDIGSGLIGMLNPNLDACFPVLLGITGSLGGHAVVCDGYGYNLETLYHHLNLGWSGLDDAWYNLPTVETCLVTFTSVTECVYNIYKTGSGEIISGRVTDKYGNPISEAIVTAERTGGGTYTATTNSKGIYALAKIPSNSEYTLIVEKEGYTFDSKTVTIGTSTNLENSSGNRWGVNFEEHTECIHQNGNEYESISGNYTISESYENGIWLQSSGTAQYRFFLPINKYYSYLDLRIYGKNRDPGYPALVEVFNWQTNSWDSLGRLYDGEGETRFLLDQTKYLSSEYSNLVVRIRCGAIYYNSHEIRDLEVHYTCEPKQWTFIVYMDGDSFSANGISTTPLAEVCKKEFENMEKIADNPNINVIVQWNNENPDVTGWSGTRRFKVNKSGNYTIGQNEWIIDPPQNMGNPQTLIEFCQWAMENWPAEHYALFLVNHGSGIQPTGIEQKDSASFVKPMGIIFDGSDYLSIKELGDALFSITGNENNKIDVLYLDVCLTGMIEVAYQVKDYVNYLVATENVGWGPQPYDEYLNVAYNTTPEYLAKNIATDYANYFNGSGYGYTISAIDLRNLSNVTSCLNDLAQLLINNLSFYKENISNAWLYTQKFDSNSDEYCGTIDDNSDAYLDLYDFADNIKQNISNSEIIQKAEELKETIQSDSFLIYENHQSGTTSGNYSLDYSHGISIFFPPSPNYSFGDFNIYKNYINESSTPANLSFTQDTQWDEFLKSYFNTPPTLSWTGEEGYESDGLEPESGDTSTQFIYRVKYVDPDNDPPKTGYPKLHILREGIEIEGSPFTMNYVSGEYETGAIYTYSITGLEAGNYTYYFEAQDRNGATATGEPISSHSGPVVNEILYHTITATAGEHGSITPSGEVIVEHGSSQTFTITADTGYHIEDVLVDGESVGAVTSYTFENVTTDHTISVTFAIDTYTISGKVTLRGGDENIQNVIVRISGDTTVETHPDMEGNYSFNNLYRGNYTLTAHLPGYRTCDSYTYTPLGQNKYNQDFVLTKIPDNIKEFIALKNKKGDSSWITLKWKNPSEIQGLLILRRDDKTNTDTEITEIPQDRVSYTFDNKPPTWESEIIYSFSDDTFSDTCFVDTGLDYGTKYYYKAFTIINYPDGSYYSEGINSQNSIRGDINEDREIDISDVILGLRMAIGLDEPNINLADLNDDGFIDITDVILILRKAIGLD